MDEHFAAAALDHVAHEGPGGAYEAQQWDAASELLAREGYGVEDVAELLFDVDGCA